MFQHTAARRRLGADKYGAAALSLVSTHSRPKAAGQALKKAQAQFDVSTHSRPKAAGSMPNAGSTGNIKFQHTAARRRLAQPTS